MNKMKIASVSIIIVTVVAIVIVYFCNKPLSKNIDTTVIGVQFRINGSPEDCELIAITIKGTAKYFLFGNRVGYYEGWFSIEGYDYTFKRIVSFELRNECTAFNPLWYPYNNSSNLLGNICTTDLEEFIIYIYETDNYGHIQWGYDSSYIICAPANDKEEAVGVLANLCGYGTY